MARPRTNDPSNLPDAPKPTSDPERLEELLSELHNRFHYLTESFEFSKKVFADNKTFNRSLTVLKRALARKRILTSIGTRIHPELEALLSCLAREYAKTDGVEVDETHIRAAGQHIVDTIKPRQGRPDNRMLELHVEGLVALIQEFSGLPVLSHRYKDSVYDPGFPKGISQMVPMIVQTWDQNITITQLVNMVRKIREKYAAKPLRFQDLFPAYGATLRDGELVLPAGISIETLEPNIPIYCP